MTYNDYVNAILAQGRKSRINLDKLETVLEGICEMAVLDCNITVEEADTLDWLAETTMLKANRCVELNIA